MCTQPSRVNLLLLPGLLNLACSCLGSSLKAQPEPPFKSYQTSWESLAQHPVPKWFQDAKFGIYAHWGVYSVPAFGNEWYQRNMYRKASNTYKHHVSKYGGPKKFGYKDFVPQFKAENFDGEAWAEFYAKAGARFAGPVAEHHDGFSMWASKVNLWQLQLARAGPLGKRR